MKSEEVIGELTDDLLNSPFVLEMERIKEGYNTIRYTGSQTLWEAIQHIKEQDEEILGLERWHDNRTEVVIPALERELGRKDKIIAGWLDQHMKDHETMMLQYDKMEEHEHTIFNRDKKIAEQDEKIRLATRLIRDQSDVIQLHKIRISELEEQLSDWEDKYEDHIQDYNADMAQARREH